MRSAKSVPEDRDDADHQRDRRGDHAAKDDEEHDRQKRERDQLGLGEVLAGLVVHLVEAGGESAHPDLEALGRELLLRVLGRGPAVVFDVLGREMARDHYRALVVGNQRAFRADVLGGLLELLVELLVQLLLRRRLEWDDRRQHLPDRGVLRLEERQLAVVLAVSGGDLPALGAADLVLGPLERAQRINGAADEVDAPQLVDEVVNLPADRGGRDVDALVVLVAHQDDEPWICVVAQAITKELG